ncbi:outer membrane beta-barrel family protein [Sphingobacterium bambusae]|uniref:Outer membrane beta-barrel protein n=1 Tax=Sphingobacterium bambusae TaxID=662858 RepID=A0ABW6BD04_9SPHI|nr:outer membrane beta-barrel protein [Sphingobacterium bambusae]WPL48867.1 outer membrane beta-barrel protein [Sphingobacterium bambusae]
MMKGKFYLRFLITAAILIIFTISAQGQYNEVRHKIRGTVIDSIFGLPVEFVTITLMGSDNTTVRVAQSKIDGTFLFEEINPDDYSLLLTIVGYRTRSLPVSLRDSTGAAVMMDLGALQMTPEQFATSEVVVSAAKPAVRQSIDRLSYDLQADADSKILTALEMMRKVPFLSLDGEENILLKGSRNYRIFINGKPSGLVERNPNDVLRSMPASSIARIEVITNPPARYDAEGMAGIINIVMLKSPDEGYKGSLTLHEKFPVGGPGLGGSMSAQIGKLQLSLLAGVALHHIPKVSNTLHRNSLLEAGNSLEQFGTRQSKQTSGYLGYEWSYQIDERQLIASQLSVNKARTGTTIAQQSLFQTVREDFKGYKLDAAKSLWGSSFDASFNYQLGFKGNKDKFLTLSYRYYGYDDLQRDEVFFSNRINVEDSNYLQSNDQRFAEQSFQLDFVSPIGSVKSEAGVKVILRNNASNFAHLFPHDATPPSNVAESIPFRYQQDVLSAYNSYEYAWGRWGVRAGARLEQTLIKANFSSNEPMVNQRYTNIIPSFALSRQLGSNETVKVAYVQQISRPSIQRLNPFVDRSNPNMESSGNPSLQPYTFNRVQLSYATSKRVSVNFGLDYTFVRNMDFRITTFDSLRNITRSTYDNIGSGDALDLSFAVRLPISKNWDLQVNGMLSSIWAALDNPSSAFSSRIIQINFTISSAYRFPKGWRASGSINPVTRSFRSPQEQANGFVGSTLGLTKELLDGKLSASMMISNPFTKYRTNNIYTLGESFTQQASSNDYFRSFGVNLTYNFGRLKEQVKNSSRGIVNDDVLRK